ncbi:uncharacterized protein LOC111291183 [Durio zibethinus]|uniref:Uncharacterized protein LOC111291183 n=1 Tax=Durio zibethinus TaxID=66656 RepID=A0A6P5YDY0_DURZI|nr:uncharacterized protein LOC111291183 [Durio zibethinus]
MNNRREQTPDRRIAKIERDRQYRRKQRREFDRRGIEEARLKALEAELLSSLAEQRRENETLAGENRRLEGRISILEDTIVQLRQDCQRLQKIMDQADSLFEYDNFPSPNEDVANNETVITHGPGSSQSTI